MREFYQQEAEKQYLLSVFLEVNTFKRHVQKELKSLTKQQIKLIDSQLSSDLSNPSIDAFITYTQNYTLQQLKLSSMTREYILPNLMLDAESLMSIYPQALGVLDKTQVQKMFEMIKSGICASLLEHKVANINDKTLSTLIAATHDYLSNSLNINQSKPSLSKPLNNQSSHSRDSFFSVPDTSVINSDQKETSAIDADKNQPVEDSFITLNDLFPLDNLDESTLSFFN